ncbi:MAG TPA: SAM-dependent methyltransferase [Stellaceae bacterium]|nr:SAM-dependent methyltransferase [Stellaceae bacterium]
MGPGEALSERIARRIRAEGPLSLAAFMAMALHDPDAGYYATRQPLGGAGDFTTAPEISQIFGELIGLWVADLWQRGGRPDPVTLVELGPGRGTLMADLLRAAASVPEFRRALRLWLVEASPVLREEQRRRLSDAAPRFAAEFGAVPEGPLLLIANEFLDALPIRQLVRGAAGWAERLVGLDDQGSLVFAIGPESPAAALLVPETLRDSAAGTVVEIGPAAAALAAAVAERLSEASGAALFLDYGFYPRAPGPTLAAIRGHRPADPLDRPGSADLSAHVDFAALAAAARAAGADVYGPVPQGRFLTALGGETRLAMLLRGAALERREALVSGLRRLIDPDEMGNLFQAIAIVSPGLPAPAGFAGDR